MVYQVEELKRDVRVALDQNMSSEALSGLGDVDTLALDEIIGSVLLEAVDRVHLSAPVYLLERGHNFGDAGIKWCEKESGWVLLPRDFLRLVVFEMSDWEQAVFTAISTDGPEYAKQRSRFKGIRGTAQKPVCVLAVRPEGLALEFYSCKSDDATIVRAVYVPRAVVDAYGGIDISERCYRGVVYTAAGLVMLSQGEAQGAQVMLERATAAV